MCYIKQKPPSNPLLKEDNIQLVLDKKEEDINIANTKRSSKSHNESSTAVATDFANLLSNKRSFPFSDNYSVQPIKKVQKISFLDTPQKSEQLLNAKDDIFNIARAGNSLLLKSISYDKINQQETLLGNTALHFAVFNNHIDFIQQIIKIPSINLNIANKSGNTPLLSAIESGHSAIIRILISNNADIAVVDRQGFGVLHKAVLNGNLEIVRYLLKQDTINVNTPSTEQKLTPLHQAAFHGKLSCIKELLRSGADISPKTSNNSTPLHMAALKNHSEVIELLLQYGAIASEKDNHQRTALHYTCIYGHLDSAKVLCTSYCPLINEKDFKNQTPLEIAAKHGLVDLIRVLSAESY